MVSSIFFENNLILDRDSLGWSKSERNVECFNFSLTISVNIKKTGIYANFFFNNLDVKDM